LSVASEVAGHSNGVLNEESWKVVSGGPIEAGVGSFTTGVDDEASSEHRLIRYRDDNTVLIREVVCVEPLLAILILGWHEFLLGARHWRDTLFRNEASNLGVGLADISITGVASVSKVVSSISSVVETLLAVGIHDDAGSSAKHGLWIGAANLLDLNTWAYR